MPGEGLDRFQAGADNFDDFVLAAAHELGQRGAYALLVIGDQNAHGGKVAEVPVPAEPILPPTRQAGWRPDDCFIQWDGQVPEVPVRADFPARLKIGIANQPFVTTVMTMVTQQKRNRAVPRIQLRQRIGQAALALFREVGFEGASVDQIVARANVSKGAFFNFFPTKADALLVYFHELDGRIDKLRAKLDPARPLPALEHFFRQAEAMLRREGSLLDALSRAIWSHPTLMKADRVSAKEDRRALTQFFERARARGKIQVADPSMAADAVGDLWTGSILMWLGAGRSYSLAENINGKLRLLFAGIRARAKR